MINKKKHKQKTDYWFKRLIFISKIFLKIIFSKNLLHKETNQLKWNAY